jgi:predicted alpha/beta hydrolase
MRRCSANLLFAVLVTAGPLFCPQAAATEARFEPVTLTTGDGVELAGHYVPGRLGRKSPAVIALDDVRAAARPDVSKAVASKLAAAGCAVLCFDFRGHGGSTPAGPWIIWTCWSTRPERF